MKAIKHTLANGLRVILLPRPESITTNLLVLVEAGSKYETKEQNGLSHFLEHMCFKGTKKRPRPLDVSSAFDSLGAHSNAFTSQEYTGYWATVQPRLLEPALELVADLYLNPLLDEAELRREKGVIIEEINLYEDLPTHRVQDLFMELLYGDQPAGWLITGTKESVAQLKREDLFSYRAKHYVAEASLIILSGNFAEAKMVDRIRDFFSSLPTAPKQPKVPTEDRQTEPQVALKYKASDQTHLVLGFRSYPLNHPAHFALEVLAAVLGGGMSSRLFRRIREELGAAYYVRATQDAYTDHGLLQAAVGADTQRVEQVIQIILEECRKLQDEPVSAEELRRTKEMLVGQLYLGLEKSSSLGLFYGLQEILKGSFLSPAEVAERIQSVSPENLRELANALFTDQQLNLALIGPFTDPEPFTARLRL